MPRILPMSRAWKLLTVALLAITLGTPAAMAKTHGDANRGNGGLYQPAPSIEKPVLTLDTSQPKVTARQGDMLREASPAPTPAAVKPVVPTLSIESMRLHALFE
jgi:hypothetical protein